MLSEMMRSFLEFDAASKRLNVVLLGVLCSATMDVGGLFMGCIARNYSYYLRALGDLLLPPERLVLAGHALTLGRKLGEGGAADVYLAHGDPSADGTSAEFAVKKVIPY
jgi:hypothetical protein